MRKEYTAYIIIGEENKTLFTDGDKESVKKFAKLAAECAEERTPPELRIRVVVYSFSSETAETSEFIRSTCEWTDWVDFMG